MSWILQSISGQMQVKQEVLYTGSVFHKKIKYMRKEYYCPICGRKLIKSEIEGYSFQCLYCDEDFTESEVIIKTKNDNEKEK